MIKSLDYRRNNNNVIDNSKIKTSLKVSSDDLCYWL